MQFQAFEKEANEERERERERERESYVVATSNTG